MRFMMVMIPRVYQPDTPPGEKAEDGFAPAAEAVAKMMKFNEELAKAGALIALDGLHPSSKGARVSFAGGKPQVTDGPFTQAKEVIGGYWMIEAKSKEEAVGWAKRCPAADGDAIEVRQVFEVSDFPQDVRNAADNPTVRVHLESGKPRDATRKDEIMKYVCLGYSDENKWETMSENEQKALFDQCFAYDDVLRKNGNFAGGEALQSARTAATLRWVNGKVSVTDGPFTETKEQLGGILVLEARDLNHAIELMSKHPGVKAGPFEIRPAADLSAMVAESERRRSRERKAS